jgi:molybdopterin molybdotransferase
VTPGAPELDEIRARCAPLGPVRVPLSEAFGRVLRETVLAPEDLPPFDRAAVDGFAIRADESSDRLRVVDEVKAGVGRAPTLAPGEAFRVATGAALLGDVRVIADEHARRDGDIVWIVERGGAHNVRKRGEERRRGEPLLMGGARLEAGALALLGSVGHVAPWVSPRPRVLHLTTGDELVPPSELPRPGQVRDTVSVLVAALLRGWSCDLTHLHLPDDGERACQALSLDLGADLLLVSGGGGAGPRDHTRRLLTQLGFAIVAGRDGPQPGRRTLFAVKEGCVAFGLPGPPLAHFVAFHVEIATALAALVGLASEPTFLLGTLGAELPRGIRTRTTLRPARVRWEGGRPRLYPLPAQSSGDLSCLADANALLRVPVGHGTLAAGVEVEFLPTTSPG